MEVNGRNYEIVSRIPANYFIWNIGENMGTCDYIPICKQLFPGTKKSDIMHYQIDADTLKAVPMNRNDVLILRKAAGKGIVSVKTARAAIKHGKNGTRVDLAKLALQILEPITD